MRLQYFPLTALLLVVTAVSSLSSVPLPASTKQDAALENRSVVDVLTSQAVAMPFKGSIQGNDSDVGFTDTTVTVQTDGTGKSTLLGRFSFTQVVTVDETSGTDSGVAHWVAADGDSIEVSVVGSGVPRTTPDSLVFDITETDTIMGATGRFANAQGSFTVRRAASPSTFLTSGSFEGKLGQLNTIKYNSLISSVLSFAP